MNQIYNIKSPVLTEEERYEVINEWIKKIKPATTFSPLMPLTAIAMVICSYLLRLYVIVFILFIIFCVTIITANKYESPKIIDKMSPHFMKIEFGIKGSMFSPTVLEIENHDREVGLTYSVFTFNNAISEPIKKQWDDLTKQLQEMIEEAEIQAS